MNSKHRNKKENHGVGYHRFGSFIMKKNFKVNETKNS